MRYRTPGEERDFDFYAFENEKPDASRRPTANRGNAVNGRTYEPGGYRKRYCGKCNDGWVYLPVEPGKKMSHKVRRCECRKVEHEVQ